MGLKIKREGVSGEGKRERKREREARGVRKKFLKWGEKGM